MTEGLPGTLVDSLRSNKQLVAALENDWGSSHATNGLKVWLADTLAAEGRRFWCGFRGKMGSFASRRRELVAEGKLDEREFILDFIAFDSNELIPSVGAEIEQSYAKKRDPYPEKERVFNRSVGTLLIEEQKDVEFYYDFTRLLTVAPKQGVFIGLSYDYEGCLAKWRGLREAPGCCSCRYYGGDGCPVHSDRTETRSLENRSVGMASSSRDWASRLGQ